MKIEKQIKVGLEVINEYRARGRYDKARDCANGLYNFIYDKYQASEKNTRHAWYLMRRIREVWNIFLNLENSELVRNGRVSISRKTVESKIAVADTLRHFFKRNT